MSEVCPNDVRSVRSFQSRFRNAHTALKTPRQKWLRLPTRHPKKNSKIVIERIKNEILKFTTEKKNISAWYATAYNERFGVIGGVCPPESLCVFASSPPAQAFVSRQPRKAATTLSASGGQRSAIGKQKKTPNF